MHNLGKFMKYHDVQNYDSVFWDKIDNLQAFPEDCYQVQQADHDVFDHNNSKKLCVVNEDLFYKEIFV